MASSTRKAPSTSAKLLPDKRRKGGDGKMWVSEKRGQAPYRWYPVAGKKTSKKKRPASKKKRPASKKKRPASKKKRPASKTKRPASKKKRPASKKKRPASKKRSAAPKKKKVDTASEKRPASKKKDTTVLKKRPAAKALKMAPKYRVPRLKRLLGAWPAESQARFKKFTSTFPAIRRLGVYIDLINFDHTNTTVEGETDMPVPGAGFVDNLWSDFQQVLKDNGLKDPLETEEFIIAGVRTFAGEDATELVQMPIDLGRFEPERWKHGKRARLVHTPGKPYYFQHSLHSETTARAVKKVLEKAGLQVIWPIEEGRGWQGSAIGVVM